MNRLALSFFGAGYLRPAPGTWGSLAALPAAWLIYMAVGPVGLAVGAGLLYALGIYAINAELKGQDDHDPSWVVIDEVVGQWIALLPVAFGAYRAGISPLSALARDCFRVLAVSPLRYLEAMDYRQKRTRAATLSA